MNRPMVFVPRNHFWSALFIKLYTDDRNLTKCAMPCTLRVLGFCVLRGICKYSSCYSKSKLSPFFKSRFWIIKLALKWQYLNKNHPLNAHPKKMPRDLGAAHKYGKRSTINGSKCWTICVVQCYLRYYANRLIYVCTCSKYYMNSAVLYWTHYICASLGVRALLMDSHFSPFPTLTIY